MSRSKKTVSSGTDYARPEVGKYKSRCIQVIDMGLQLPYDPSWNSTENMMFIMKLVETNHVFDKELGEQPFVVNRELRVDYISETSKTGTFLNTWVPGTVSAGSEINFSSFVGLSGLTTVVEKAQKKDPKKFNIVIDNIQPGSKDFPPARNPLLFFEIGSNNCKYKLPDDAKPRIMPWFELFPLLYKWIQKNIARTETFKEACKKDNIKVTYDDKDYPTLKVGPPFGSEEEEAISDHEDEEGF